MSRNKIIQYEWDARSGLINGVEKLARAVKSTLGPSGRNVVINKDYGSPVITKDGVTVAREVFLKDPLENIGAQLLKDVASQTNDSAGDGTTTSTVLAEAVIKGGTKALQTGLHPMGVKSGIDKATNAVVERLKETSIQISTNEQIEQVGTISANNDKTIGKLIANAMELVGKSGIITVEEGKSTETYLDVVEGIQFQKGYLSPHFVTNSEKMTVELENPFILIMNEKISNVQDLLPILEAVSQQDGELLIVADDVEAEALATLVINKLRGLLKVCAVKSPSFGDRKLQQLEDVAILTGATVVSKDTGVTIEEYGSELLGTAEKVTIDKESTTIVDGKGDSDKIADRVSQIEKLIENTDNDWEKEKLSERLAQISGGVAVLYIGASSEVEMKERKDRVDDALHATRAAVEEGIVAGGGVALIRCREVIDQLTPEDESEKFGFELMKKVLESPMTTILSNAGKSDASYIINKIMENDNINYGYNARTEQYEDLVESGIIDPTKVTRTALENATSIAGLLLTTDVVMYNDPDQDDDKPHNPHQGMGGMM